MRIIKDRSFEDVQKKYRNHCLDIVLLDGEGTNKGTIGHKTAVIYAMTSNIFSNLRGQDYKADDFNLGIMQCERINPSDFFKMCKVIQRGSHKKPLFEYSDGYVPDGFYALGTKSNDRIKIMYSYAWLNSPYPTNYSMDDFEFFNNVLFPNGRGFLDIYRWKDNFCDKYFLPGKEWWGTGLWSVYDKTLDRFVIIGASQTD